MADQAQDESGRLVMANATPFVWRLTTCEKTGMKKFTFPRVIQPGQTVTARIEFGGGKSHGQTSYQVRIWT